MYGVLIALLPAFLVSLYFFGVGALIVTLTSVLACVFFEWAIGKFIMKKETTTVCDGSAIITGVLLAFNCLLTCLFGLLSLVPCSPSVSARCRSAVWAAIPLTLLW